MRDDLVCDASTKNDQFGMYERHLREIADQIEWKLQILSHACPFDWKGSKEFAENPVSVGPVGELKDTDIAGGNLGG